MDMKKYLHLFIDEAEKHIKNLFSLISQLKDTDKYEKTVINEVFRSSHSIKGMSSALGFSSMAETAHMLEEIFHYYRKNQTPVDIEYIPKLMEASELLYNKLSRIKEKNTDDISSENIMSALKGVMDKLNEASMPEEAGQPDSASQQEYPSAIIHFRKMPLAMAKAFVLIKRIKANYSDASFIPSYEEIKKGHFEGILEIVCGHPDIGKFLKDQVSSESYIERIEYLKAGLKDKTHGDSLKGDIALQAPQPTAESQRASSAGKKIWLGADTLDSLINRLGQLYIHKSMLSKSLQEDSIHLIDESFSNVSSLIDRIYNNIISLRMVPFRTVSEEFPFIIKMVSSRQNKSVNFEIKGSNIEIDRIILEELKNPLVHILRNAVDHGIETPDERGEKGKDIKGHIRINVERKSEFISISLRDDGRGLDTAKITRRALELNLITRKEAESISDNEALMLIARPGFTMRREASDISGRGVGMDIVKTTIESLGGRLIINTEKDVYTDFILQVPLTMAIQEVVVVNNQGYTFALPSRSIMTTAVAEEKDIVTDNGFLFIKHGDTLYPAYRINSSFGFTCTQALSYPLHVIMVENAPNPNAMIIDEIIETKKAVIQKARFPFSRYNFLSAVTIDDYGKPMMIIDPLRLIRYNTTSPFIKE